MARDDERVSGGGEKGAPEKITEEEVQAVARRLERFARDLAPKERALLNLVIARAKGVGAIDAHEYVPRASIAQTVSQLLHPLVELGTLASGWVEAGDPWIQGGGWVEAGDPWIQGGGGGGWVEAGDPWIQGGSQLNEFILRANPTDLGRFLNAGFRARKEKG